MTIIMTWSTLLSALPFAIACSTLKTVMSGDLEDSSRFSLHWGRHCLTEPSFCTCTMTYHQKYCHGCRWHQRRRHHRTSVMAVKFRETEWSSLAPASLHSPSLQAPPHYMCMQIRSLWPSYSHGAPRPASGAQLLQSEPWCWPVSSGRRVGLTALLFQFKGLWNWDPVSSVSSPMVF